MKTKFAMLLAVILVTSIFAGALTIAENSAPKTSSDDTAVSFALVSDMNNVASEKEIENTIGEMEKINPYKKIGFSKIWVGNGWVENTDGGDGYLIQGFWVKQAFAKNGNSNALNAAEVASEKTDKTFGKLRIGPVGKYKLVLKSSTGTTEEPYDADTITFDVIPVGKEAPEDYKGILFLEKSEQFKQLTIWKGKLMFDGGIIKGNWDVSIGTNKNTIKPESVQDSEDDESIQERRDNQASPSLMQKWFGKKEVNTGNKAENSDDNSGVTDSSENEKPKKIPFWKKWFSTSNVEDSSQ